MTMDGGYYYALLLTVMLMMLLACSPATTMVQAKDSSQHFNGYHTYIGGVTTDGAFLYATGSTYKIYGGGEGGGDEDEEASDDPWSLLDEELESSERPPSKCFLWRAPLNDLTQIVAVDAMDPEADWDEEAGQQDVYCTAMALIMGQQQQQQQQSKMSIVVGSAIPPGPFQGFSTLSRAAGGVEAAAEYGFLMQHSLLNSSLSSSSSSSGTIFAEYLNSMPFPETPVLYPQAVVTNAAMSMVYVASEYSSSATFTASYEDEAMMEYPNWLSTHRFGDHYQVHIHLHPSGADAAGVEEDGSMIAANMWADDSIQHLGGPEASVRVGNLLTHTYFDDELGEEVESLILVGSIVGMPSLETINLLGEPTTSETVEEAYMLTFHLDTTTGQLDQGDTLDYPRPFANPMAVVRDEVETYFANLCAIPNSPDIYVVGAIRESSGRLVPTISRIRLPSGTIIWTTEYYPDHPFADAADIYASALQCQAEHDPVTGHDMIFVAGQQMNGGTVLDDPELSTGKAEVWLGLIQGSPSEGKKLWTVEIGSTDGKELLGGLVLDNQGNPIVVGTTTGIMYNSTTTSDRRTRHLAEELNNDYSTTTTEKKNNKNNHHHHHHHHQDRSLFLFSDSTSDSFVVRVDKATGAFDPPFVNPLDSFFGGLEDFFNGFNTEAPEELEGEFPPPASGAVEPVLPKDPPPIAAGAGAVAEVLDDSFSAQSLSYQSGPDLGPSYAGGMSYDPITQTLYFTGASYGLFGKGNFAEDSMTKGSCFVTTMSALDLSPRAFEMIGTSDSTEACAAIQVQHVRDLNGALATRILGVAEEGGYLQNLVQSSNNENPGDAPRHHGFVADLNSQSLRVDEPVVIDRGPMPYPTALDICPDEGHTYVATVEMQNADMEHLISEQDDEYPNWTRGGYWMDERPTTVKLEKYSKDMVLEYSLPLVIGERLAASYPSGLINTDEAVVVVGTSRSAPDAPTHGFLAKVDNVDGEVGSATLIQAPKDRDVTINQVCQDPLDKNTIYVVGGTTGTLVESLNPKAVPMMEPFVSKYNVETMTELWTAQLTVVAVVGLNSDEGPNPDETNAQGLGCAVFSRFEEGGPSWMYVAGSASGGVRFDFGVIAPSPGDDQVFVAQLNTDTGDIYWAQQFGAANGDVHLARGGGVVALANGDAVIFGETTGNLFRNATEGISTPMTTDIFVMGFDNSFGSHADPIAMYSGLEDDWGDLEAFFNTLFSESAKTTTTASIVWLVVTIVAMACLGGCAFFGIYKLSRQLHNRPKYGAGISSGRISYEQVLSVEEREAANLAPAVGDDYDEDEEDDKFHDEVVDDNSATGLSRNL